MSRTPDCSFDNPAASDENDYNEETRLLSSYEEERLGIHTYGARDAVSRDESLADSALSDSVSAAHDTHDPDGTGDWRMPLHVFTSKRKGDLIKSFRSKKVRSFYKEQDELISMFENFSFEMDKENNEVMHTPHNTAYRLTQISFILNMVLLAAKLTASILSGSMSIISSLVDSVVDVFSSLVLWWAVRAIRARNPYNYPQGRTKLEPVAVLILSVIMSVASLQLLWESVKVLIDLIDGSNCLPKCEIRASDNSSCLLTCDMTKDDNSSCISMCGITTSDKSSCLPQFEITTISIAASTVVTKFLLWLICRRVNNPTIQALAQDHRNDVLSNSVAIVCGYLGSQEFQDQTGYKQFIYSDPIGAILIGFYIIFNWWITGKEQVKLLTGISASPEFLAKLTWLTINHSPNIKYVETVQAYHFGNNCLVEVDIVLPKHIHLHTAHDIGESLQRKLETLPEVERAFVHVDYDFHHHPTTEHKTV
ncbi:metal tolerance protein 6-like [Pomacea canaliculata]|uniref:metal tolerance protein 6-like n=1 Tax=Pomacea canaliculata TaxID=400727 RepID=UPI000D73DEA2|nr:metal tolerance protein 6-like [Pomacea canaliculata]